MLLAIISGIVGNRADAAANSGLPWLSRQLARDIPAWWVGPLVLGAIGSLLLALFIWDRWFVSPTEVSDDLKVALDVERHASHRTDQLVRMGDSLLRLLARLSKDDDIEIEFARLLEEHLRDATGVFEGDVSRGIVLRRDGNELVPWVGYQMPESTMARSRFRIKGSGLEARGIASLAYQSEVPIVVHFRQHEGRLVSDMPNDYIVFDEARPYPPYRSFIAVPIRGEGVLCFDSMKVDVFDSSGIQQLLESMAVQMGYAIEIYRRIRD